MQMSPTPELGRYSNASEKYRELLKVSNHPTQGQQMEFVFKNWSCFLTRYNCTAVNRSGNESYQVSINNSLADHCLIHALLNNNNNMI